MVVRSVKRCAQCGSESSSTASLCYNCGAELSDTPVETASSDGTRLTTGPAVVQTPPDGATSASASSSATTPLARRYDDAYGVARAVIGVGSFMKILAVILGGLIALVSLVIASQSSLGAVAGLVGLITAGSIGLAIYISGVLITATGQIMRATLDTAVNTSPLLSHDDVSRIMSLS
jgi:hypothetical protein